MHSIIIIQDGQIEYTNDHFLDQFQEPIKEYGDHMRESGLYESFRASEIKVNRPLLSCCRFFKKSKKEESEAKKESNDFLSIKLFEQVDLN